MEYVLEASLRGHARADRAKRRARAARIPAFASWQADGVVVNTPELVVNTAPDVVVNTQMVVNTPRAVVVNTASRHGKYADLDRRKAYQLAWMRTKRAKATP